ncbi:MAG TPA: FHA domain-containing protein [Thermoanaerobaculia bacterium]|nr:FHA domain-containing protein [Thermoanaerobaculia bacterium]
MIECSSCHTLNPDAELSCVLCGRSLAAAPPGSARSRPAGDWPTALCPAGHPIDPAWKSCPYCERQQTAAGAAARRATRLEGEPGAGGPSAPPAAEAPGDTAEPSGPLVAWPPPPPEGASVSAPGWVPKPTRLEQPPGPPSGPPRVTVLAEPGTAAPAVSLRPLPEPQAAPAAAVPGPGPEPAGREAREPRRLVAVLVAPDLGPTGAVFAVRAGKNTLGADRASDICLGDDPRVSGEHALLLCRRGGFLLADRMSTNGTWVNDEEVPASGTMRLRDRDRIRCGGVELLFLAIEPPLDPATGAASGEGTP